MGDMTNLYLHDDVCGTCGKPFDAAGEGFPRYCRRSCEPEGFRSARAGGGTTIEKGTRCPGCRRLVRGLFALAQHRKAKGH